MWWKYFVVGLSMLVVGSVVGWVAGSVKASETTFEHTKRQTALQARVEAYIPSCQEQGVKGVHAPVNVGRDTIVVEVKEHSFIVFGFNSEPGVPPATWWWGAEKSCP